MRGVRTETQRAANARNQPHSTALSGSATAANFFGGIYDRRWRANVEVLEKKATPEWRQLVALDAQASYPAEFQSAIVKLLAERHIRHLERTAILLSGEIAETLRGGSLVRLGEGELVFVTGLPEVADRAAIQVLAHRDGVFKFKNPEGEMKTAWKYRYYRNAE